MTLERPMFPPAAGCEIIQFSAIKARKPIARPPSGGAAIYEPEELTFVSRERKPLAEPQTETCRNQRLRDSRQKAWYAARSLTEYWRAKMDWISALSLAQKNNVGDANSEPKCDYGTRQEFVDLWRVALLKQILTPAPDVNAVNWKRAQLRADHMCLRGYKAGELQSVIDADAEWLKDHPTRRSIAASRQKGDEQ
jgi:hypothetical protein